MRGRLRPRGTRRRAITFGKAARHRLVLRSARRPEAGSCRRGKMDLRGQSAAGPSLRHGRAASMNSGGEPLHPPVDGDVIDGDTALGQQLLDITVGQAVPQVPADRHRRDQDHLVRSNTEAQSPAGDAQPRTSLPISGCLAPSRSGNAALRGRASADAPERPVLDVRNQPESHRPRRTDRRISRASAVGGDNAP